MEEILQKAKELGVLISESKVFSDLKNAEDKQFEDKEATEMMARYITVRDELTKKASNPEISSEEKERITKELDDEFAKLCENENIRNYLDANSAFSSLINQVNSIISYFVKGGVEEGCSGNCSSCGGCH